MALKRSIDTPTNTFATLNPLFQDGTNKISHNGNLTYTSIGSNSSDNVIGITQNFPTFGKWYLEVFAASITSATSKFGEFGIADVAQNNFLVPSYSSSWLGHDNTNSNSKNLFLVPSYGSGQNGQIRYGSWDSGTKLIDNIGWVDGATAGIFLDCDSDLVTWLINGNIILDKVSKPNLSNGTHSLLFSFWRNDSSTTYHLNFGQNPTFCDSHTPSRIYTDASGYGEFAYEPPPGAMALCSANITPANVVSAPYVVDETGNHSISVAGTNNVEVSNKSPYLSDVDITLSPNARHTEMKSRASQNFKGGSYAIDRTAGLTIKGSETTTFGTGDFAIECWVYMDDIAAQNYWTICDFREGGSDTDSFFFGVRGHADSGEAGGGLYLHSGTTSRSFVQTLTSKTWHHVVLVRENSNINCFLDGATGTSDVYANDLSATNDLTIGWSYHAPTSYRLVGKIADFRLTKGKPVYTGPFTPPTEPLQLEEGKDQILLQPWKQAITLGGYKQADESQENVRDHFSAVAYQVENQVNKESEVNVGFNPDLTWIKCRDAGESNYILDTVRDSDYNTLLKTNSTVAQFDVSAENPNLTITKKPTGFSLETTNTGSGELYFQSRKYICWNWKAGGAPTSDDPAVEGSAMVDGTPKTIDNDAKLDAGDITPRKMSVNTKAGFSIVKYVGNNSSSGSSVPHGLNSKVEFVIIKNLDSSASWAVYHRSTSNLGGSSTDVPYLERSTMGVGDNISIVDSTTVTLPSSWSGVNSSENFIMYSWHSVPGYSAFGSYEGNDNADGSFVHTGFKPAFVMVKNIDDNQVWNLWDNVRDGKRLIPNENYGDQAAGEIELYSNGFKLTSSNSANNDQTCVYMAFADSSALGELKTKSKKNPMIVNPKQGFKAMTWVGDGSPDGVKIQTGFKPDLIWAKNRDDTHNHQIHDSVRGSEGGVLYSNQPDAQNPTYSMKSFDADGFTLSGGLSAIHPSGNRVVAWAWKAGGSGADFMKDDEEDTSIKLGGTIEPTKMSVNTKAGFSIVKYNAGGNVPHGLNKAPDFIITKNLDTTYNWDIYHSSVGNSGIFTSAAMNSRNAFGSVDDNTFATVDTFTHNGSNEYIAYCWHSVPGYSAFESYTGNGSTNGPFIYTGFKPAFVMIKRTDAAGYPWMMYDNKRSEYNPVNTYLFADDNTFTESQVDTSGNYMDFLSNGIKLGSGGGTNGSSSSTYIYIAFAEQPYEFATSR